MKTRIVYPQLWLDEKFAECKQSTKLFFMYLITNQSLGLSRFTRLSDRKISFDTGLNTVQINEAKEELIKLKWCFFKEEWIFHNHNCAYVDYKNNERVLTSKQKEIDLVPKEIIEYFNLSCSNKVETTLEQSSNINKKSKTINQKRESVRGSGASPLFEASSNPSLKVLEQWNKVFGTNFTSTRSIDANLTFWLEVYSLTQILEAVSKAKKNPFWKDKINPVIMLRRKNPRGEDVDYVGELLNYGKKPTAQPAPWEMKVSQTTPKYIPEPTEQERLANRQMIASMKKTLVEKVAAV